MILVIDTADSEKTFLGIWQKKWLNQVEWSAGRNLSAEILLKIQNSFDEAGIELKEISGIVVNVGPGSFTGLRIGISVANAFAYSLKIPIVGISEVKSAETLLEKGQKLLVKLKKFDQPIVPEYGREPNISQPKNKR